MSEWKEVEMEEILESANTGLDAIKRAPIVDYNSGIKCLRIQDISQEKEFQNWGFCEVEERNYKKFKLIKGDIIVARTGATVGVNRFIKGDLPSVYNNGLIRLRVNRNECLPEYLYYNLRTSHYKGFIESISGGTSTQPNMQINALLDMTIMLPPIPEQQAIADVLSSLDNKIDLLNRQNKTLEQLAETLFRQWFIEEAKEEWEVKPLSVIAEFLNGLACQKFPPKNLIDRLPVLKIKELKDGFTENSDWATNEVPSKYHVSNGDVIFSWSASLVVKIWDGEECVLNQHLFKVTSEDFPKWFYYLWSRYHLQKFIAIANAHATTMGHIKRGDLDEAQVNIPSKTEIEEYNITLEPITDKIISNNKQIKTLEKQRDTLIPKLISGEVRIKMDKNYA